MAYSEKVIDHYQNPRNIGTLDKESKAVGTGLVGAPECGDVMRLQIEVDDATGLIKDAKFKTFGCGSAIASSSLATEWLKGKSIESAMEIDNMEIVEELALPPVKIHCSVLAEDAIKMAINDYRVKQGLEPIVDDKKTYIKGDLETQKFSHRQDTYKQGMKFIEDGGYGVNRQQNLD